MIDRLILIYQQRLLQKGQKIVSRMSSCLSHCYAFLGFVVILFFGNISTAYSPLSVTEWLKNYFTNLHNLSATNKTFGFFRKDFLLINHIIILCKQVIFQCRNLNIKPSLSLLKAKIKITHKLELSIAKQNKKLEVHNKKWKELLSVVQC